MTASVHVAALDVACPHCKVESGAFCVRPKARTRIGYAHLDRRKAAQAANRRAARQSRAPAVVPS